MSDNTNNAQYTAYNNFIKNPSPQNALDFVISCYKYISILASKWQNPSLTRKNKINEIITEMYLILLEDFSAGKAVNCQSAFSYLDLKLRRLVNPARKHFFSDITEVSPQLLSTKDNYTFEKICMIEEIVHIIRSNVLENYLDKSGLVIFLFIHIYPKIHWISELMAKRTNIPVESRYEADAKRINRFNNRLRKDFNNLTNGDWHEIRNWSHAERSHLAWKIINIAPEEVDNDISNKLILIEKWRENFDVHSSQNLDNLSLAEKIYQSMAKNFPKNPTVSEEEVDFWGKPINIISQLIGEFYEENSHIEESKLDIDLFDNSSNYDNIAEEDTEFLEVAKELSNWFGKLLNERNKRKK